MRTEQLGVAIGADRCVCVREGCVGGADVGACVCGFEVGALGLREEAGDCVAEGVDGEGGDEALVAEVADVVCVAGGDVAEEEGEVCELDGIRGKW